MFEITRKPIHPGGILRRECMKPLGMSVTSFAAHLGISRKTLSKIINERGSVTPNIALRLARAFPPSAKIWLSLQMDYDLWEAQHCTNEWKTVKPLPQNPIEPHEEHPELHTSDTVYLNNSNQNVCL